MYNIIPYKYFPQENDQGPLQKFKQESDMISFILVESKERQDVINLGLRMSKTHVVARWEMLNDFTVTVENSQMGKILRKLGKKAEWSKNNWSFVTWRATG